MPPPRTRLAAALAAVAVVVAAVPAPAPAARANGITPTSPRKGATVPAGRAVSFTGRVTGPGVVEVYVCRSAKRSRRDGTICHTQLIVQAKRRGSRFSVRQRPFAYPAYWLNRPGRYYWQAHRIACEGTDTADCRQEGPVVRFRVR